MGFFLFYFKVFISKHELIEKRNETLICAVLFATKNSFLLEKAMLFFKMNKNIKETIAQRKRLSRKLIEQLSQDQDPEIRSIIARRPDLDKDIIHQLAEDEGF